MIDLLAGIGGCAAWSYLVCVRGAFWRCAITDTTGFRANPKIWPAVAAIVPARDEAYNIGRSLRSLIRQKYPGRLSIFVVDDQSMDETARVAKETASAEVVSARSVAVIPGRPVPDGWTGKLWAMRQGLAAVEEGNQRPEFVLFTDADIELGPHVLRRLVSIGRARNAVLTSLMVKLKCESFAERQLAPAFVFFFQMLYPFAWANNPGRATAAAAGGCMLVDRAALEAVGGLEAMRGALIDDCALAAVMKRRGPIWLGLTQDAFSFRAYPTIANFGGMVARSAFAELRFSALRLALAVAGMAFVFLVPPLLVLFAEGWGRAAGAVAWAMMALAFAPTLRFYRLPVIQGLALPLVAAAYVGFTMQSAMQFWRGEGGMWKGRVQAPSLARRA